MKFSIAKGKLLLGLQNVLSVVPTRSTLPVLSNILIEAQDGKLKLSATDLEMSVTTILSANVTKKGVTTVPAKTFGDIIRELPEVQVEVSVTDTRMEIKAEKGTYRLSGVPAEEFPKLPEFNGSKEVKVPAQDLVQMVTKTVFAASKDETRPALNGVLWQMSGDKMIMVATDGHRLAKIGVENKKLKGLPGNVIVPPKVLNMLERLVGDQEKEIGLVFSDSHIVFNLGDSILTSRLIEGPYPNYEQVIPKNNDKRLSVPRDQMTAAVRRVAILSNSLTHQVKLTLKKSQMELSASNADVGGDAREVIPCSFSGDEMEIGYNAQYVLDTLKQFDSDEVVFDLATPVSAGTIHAGSVPTRAEEKKPADAPQADYFCLLMPLRLTE